MKLTKRPSWALGALAAGASIAVTIGLATPARAALSGTDWTSVPLSDGVTQGIADGPAVHPVSCVSGTTFCVAIVGDMDNIVNGSYIGQAALVTTDAGQTWSTNVTLPSTVFPITALSCVTTSVCWASGYSSNGGPGVAESTDGGLHWSDRTPSDLGQRRALVAQLHRLRVRDDLLDGRVVTDSGTRRRWSVPRTAGPTGRCSATCRSSPRTATATCCRRSPASPPSRASPWAASTGVPAWRRSSPPRTAAPPGRCRLARR